MNADIRKHIILKNLPHWGGKLTYYGGNSYTPELEALAHTLAILPSTWNINIYTDSNSAIEALENLHSAPRQIPTPVTPLGGPNEREEARKNQPDMDPIVLQKKRYPLSG